MLTTLIPASDWLEYCVACRLRRGLSSACSARECWQGTDMASRGLRILGYNVSTLLRTHRTPLRTCPQLMCTAAQQPNNPVQESEEEKSKKQVEEATEQLAAEKAKLEEQVKEVTDKFKRALADTENMRQRSQKMVEDAKLYGIQGFCKDLLEVADILEKATQSVPKEEIKDENPHLKNLYEGLVMTEVQMQKVFKKHGIVKLNPVGAKFDPYEHEALFHTPVEGKEPGTVALVTKVGYKLHERTLRPALVGVVKGT